MKDAAYYRKLNLPISELLSDKTRPIHIIAGGGVGMSALALLLMHSGYRVSASDLSDSPYLQKLAEKGASIWIGSQPEKILPESIVFFSSAVKENDPERRFAAEQGLPNFSRHLLLEFVTSQYTTIAVAGCHGKTTTTAWIAHVLEACGLDPTAMVGGTVHAWDSNVRLGKGKLLDKPLLVMEADESDGSFLHIHAHFAIITNIDLDHTDLYKDMRELRNAYFEFAQRAKRLGGEYVPGIEMQNEFAEICADKIQRILRAMTHTRDHLLYNHLSLFPNLPGLHNLFNASVVIVLCEILGLTPDRYKPALESFSGVGRRMEILKTIKINSSSCDIIDDYGHHPREIEVVIDTLKQKYDDIIVVWEPHRITRFTHFFQEFKNLFEPLITARKLFTLPLFAAGDKPGDFPDFAQKLEWFDAIGKSIKESADFPALAISIEQSAQAGAKIACVFFGAGNSSAQCREFVKFTERGR